MDRFVWIASYPRSGNTFLRILLRNCLGLRSGSFYADDFPGRPRLAELVGHVEHETPGKLVFQPNELRLVKTHEHCTHRSKAIYIVRDGRASAASLWKLFGGKFSLRAVVEGKTEFGLWQDHVDSWNPAARPNTLFLRYEDVVADPLAAVEALAGFLDRPILSRDIPTREAAAGLDGTIVTKPWNWRDVMTDDLEQRFVELNRRQLSALGYC